MSAVATHPRLQKWLLLTFWTFLDALGVSAALADETTLLVDQTIVVAAGRALLLDGLRAVWNEFL